MILSVGLTALAGLSVQFSRQSRLAWERTETAIARHNMHERLWATPFDSIATRGESSETHIVQLSVTDESPRVKVIYVRDQILDPCDRPREKEKGVKDPCEADNKNMDQDKAESFSIADTTAGVMGVQSDTFTVRRLKW